MKNVEIRSPGLVEPLPKGMVSGIQSQNTCAPSPTLKIGALTKLGLFFPVVCFIHVFDQTLAEKLYRDKGYLATSQKT